jgi:CheY-like chemotaxis protein
MYAERRKASGPIYRYQMDNWDDKLRELGDALIDHPARTQLPFALRLLRKCLGARAAVAVQSGQVIAHDGHEPPQHQAISDAPAVLLVQLAAEKGVAVRVDDTRQGPFVSRRDSEQLWEIGYAGAIAVPLQHRGVDHGGIALWFGEEFDQGTDPTKLPANYILSAVRQLLTLAFERDNRAISPEGALTSLGEVNRLASLGLMLDSALVALRGPSSSMLIQIDELRRLTAELQHLADPTDHALGDVLAEVGQTLDDITLAASLVRKELSNLSDLSPSEDKKERVQLSRLVHEAAVIARPELEHRGLTVQERVAQDGYIYGDRHELLHLALGLLFTWSRDDKLAARRPVIEIQLRCDDERCVISVIARTPTTSPAPTPPSACLRIVEAHAGHLTSSPGVLEVSFPNHAAPSKYAKTAAPISRRILLVDDDPMFARALRRALSPHDVRVCGTAADAEIALMEAGYEPDLVICDLWLPGTNGRALHEKISDRQPRVASRFVFVSGAPVGSKDVQYFADAGCPTLAKPISVADLLPILERNASSKQQAPLD